MEGKDIAHHKRRDISQVAQKCCSVVGGKEER